LALDVPLGWGVNASTTFGGTTHLKIWEGKKRSKIGVTTFEFKLKYLWNG